MSKKTVRSMIVRCRTTPISAICGRLLLCAVLLFTGFGVSVHADANHLAAPEHIMFGSCLDETRPHPVLEVAVERAPQLFLFLGDNVYADSTRPQIIRRAYEQLGESPLFRRLSETSRIHAVWDDHDYGANDAGAGFPARRVSEQIFEEFWNVKGPAAERPGIYRELRYGDAQHRVQIILLDTRYFRSPLKRAPAPAPSKGPYAQSGEEGTLLGQAQWRWLEHILAQPARLRIIVSGIQVLAQHHGWESWANFPRERRRLLSLVAGSSGAAVFLSGDRHFAEISRISAPPEAGQAYFTDVTSSGINRSYPAAAPTPNAHRVNGHFLESNIGELQIYWDEGAAAAPRVRARIYDVSGRVRIEHMIELRSRASSE